MKASTFIRITNREQLGIDIGDLDPGEARIVANPALDQPDRRDPLNRTFMAFGLLWEGRFVLGVQPTIEKRLVSMVSPEWDAAGLNDRMESILSRLGVDGGSAPIEVRRNRLYSLDETDHVEPFGVAVVLIRGDQMKIRKLVGNGPFACSDEAIDSGLSMGIFKDGELVSICYTIPTRDPVFSQHAYLIAILTKPEHSGHGFAKSVLSHTAHAILSRGMIAAYGCRDTNTASAATAESVGFRLAARTVRCWETKR